MASMDETYGRAEADGVLTVRDDLDALLEVSFMPCLSVCSSTCTYCARLQRSVFRSRAPARVQKHLEMLQMLL